MRFSVLNHDYNIGSSDEYYDPATEFLLQILLWVVQMESAEVFHANHIHLQTCYSYTTNAVDIKSKI
jgi:hypothetical protein